MTDLHTPTPWYNDDNVVRQAGTNSQICLVTYDEGQRAHEDITNAAFIVRACNIHGALVESLETAHQLLQTNKLFIGSMMDLSIAAILTAVRGDQS
jgi:hypothetical protein